MKKKVKSSRAKPIADGAETISGRRREILRTARRKSPPGSGNGSARTPDGSGTTFAFVRNPAGIRIKVCCASCQWKQLTSSLVTRKCRRLKKRVKPRHYCGFWGMSDGINTIAGEAVGNFAEAAQQLKLKVGGWVQERLRFSMKKINWWNVVLEVVRVLVAALSGAGAATMM